MAYLKVHETTLRNHKEHSRLYCAFLMLSRANKLRYFESSNKVVTIPLCPTNKARRFDPIDHNGMNCTFPNALT
jgi:hypothetical protein